MNGHQNHKTDAQRKKNKRENPKKQGKEGEEKEKLFPWDFGMTFLLFQVN